MWPISTVSEHCNFSMSELVDVNIATLEELVVVPSIGHKTARRVIGAHDKLVNQYLQTRAVAR